MPENKKEGSLPIIPNPKYQTPLCYVLLVLEAYSFREEQTRAWTHYRLGFKAPLRNPHKPWEGYIVITNNITCVFFVFFLNNSSSVEVILLEYTFKLFDDKICFQYDGQSLSNFKFFSYVVL